MSPLRLTSLALTFLALSMSAAAKNYIYKGSVSSTDLVTNKTTTISTYLVLGEEAPINPPDGDNYTSLKGSFVFVNGVLGSRRFAVVSAGNFRSLERTEPIPRSMRTKVVEMISFTDADESDTGNGFHNGNITLLVGTHAVDLRYDNPKTLKGWGLNVNGGLSPVGPPFGGASRSSYRFSIVSALTDPIPTGESLAGSVKRVTDFLTARGYIQFVP